MYNHLESFANVDLNLTLPKLLANNFREFGDRRIALRKKDFGIWQERTWKDYYEQVKYFSLCLIKTGLQGGDRVCIIGDNDPEWWIAELASQAGLAIPVGIFPDSIPSEVQYIADHSKCKFIIARDQEQCDKILDIKDKLPSLVKLFYWDPKGMWSYDDPILCSFEKALQIGMDYERDHVGLFEEILSKGRINDLAVLCYTSGTTGLPKAAMLSYRNMLLGGLNLLYHSPLASGDNYLAFLSPAWATEQVLGIAATLYFAATTCFAEKTDTLRTDMREIGPKMIFYGSRQWENIVSEIEVGMIDTSFLKRIFYRLFLPVGYKIADAYYDKKKARLFWRALYKLGDWLVFRKIRDYLGLSKLRLAITAGSYLGPAVIKYFRALNIIVYNIYGLTEAVSATTETPACYKLGSAGKAAPGVQIKISEGGEVLIRGENIFLGYYKDPGTTNEKLVDGWFRTGDAGYIDEEGYFFYLDRVKDMAVMRNGTRFSPTYIESALKFSLYIKDSMVLGIGQEYIAVVINIDFDTVGKWAEKRHIVYTTYADLSQKKEVYDLIQNEIQNVNKNLPENNRVKRFVNLHKEFDPDEGELTRTRKIRRKFMEERYRQIIDAIYAELTNIRVTVDVKYRDGRKGKIETDIGIRNIE
jgi:long-chain acyl-CoA synthetase